LGYAEKEMRRLFGKALNTREMLRDGDHVLVAVSGGLDSLSLLWLLREQLRRAPIRCRMTAVHVDPGFGVDSASQMETFFALHGFEHRVIRSDMGVRAHSEENRENPCFLCSRLRRKTLFRLAEEMGCKRIAFGHHKDDLIETFFLNLLYGASATTMTPVQELFGGKISLIRPLYMIDRDQIRRYAKAMGWNGIDLGCPTAGHSKREEIREMLTRFYRGNRKIRGNIFHALHNVRPEYLL
jgi:tRNA 2-thiocytidine biosynthesis protein TtcA